MAVGVLALQGSFNEHIAGMLNYNFIVNYFVFVYMKIVIM